MCATEKVPDDVINISIVSYDIFSLPSPRSVGGRVR